MFFAMLCSMNIETKAQAFEPSPGEKNLNFGIGTPTWGFPVYVGMDFGITDKITIGPRLTYRHYNHGIGGIDDFGYNVFNVAFRGDYHFGSHIDGLPRELDLYGGLSLGYSAWGNNYDDDNFPGYDPYDSGVLFSFQAGGRWFFNDQWAGNAEIVAGTMVDRSYSGLELGMSYYF